MQLINTFVELFTDKRKHDRNSPTRYTKYLPAKELTIATSMSVRLSPVSFWSI